MHSGKEHDKLNLQAHTHTHTRHPFPTPSDLASPLTPSGFVLPLPQGREIVGEACLSQGVYFTGAPLLVFSFLLLALNGRNNKYWHIRRVRTPIHIFYPPCLCLALLSKAHAVQHYEGQSCLTTTELEHFHH